MKPIDQFQEIIVNKLITLLEAHNYQPLVKSFWRPFIGYRKVYAPILDIAVGPYAIENGTDFSGAYIMMSKKMQSIIETWKSASDNNYKLYVRDILRAEPEIYSQDLIYSSNNNPRCFIAIEIENTNSKKHQMGSIINLAALGHVGIFVAWQDAALRTAMRMREYFDLLKGYGKPSFNINNVIIISKEQLLDSLKPF